MEDLWIENNTIERATGVLSEFLVWLVFYGVASVSWMVHKGMPIVGGLSLEIKARSHVRKLETERKITDCWMGAISCWWRKKLI